jgi:magnesium-protoporphyrin O-methyltransferase
VDHVVAMDSLIHYDADDVQAVIGDLSTRARHSVLFTSAPWTPALGLMHFVGRLIPHRHHRAPAIEPVRVKRLMRELAETHREQGWNVDRTHRVKSGFYISQAVGLTR